MEPRARGGVDSLVERVHETGQSSLVVLAPPLVAVGDRGWGLRACAILTHEPQRAQMRALELGRVDL